ncbi:Protein of unknown function DUF356 [Methanocaldococcus sp. FS406-22]|uniref:DUF356 domain-containing protein n=1 Tax=Methanocaldococcus sp. (strain FS406-22) TaxID=644281 RepID=UPI0001BF2A2E|nr:DUF356 domain-containing protein [Methanocaldococcus sp. FS406-22]ADC69878.1 Protein of unknown function DUF356 [Methanocaldococcus sp. FS406-22]
MTILLIRGDSYEKLKNALADVDRHAELTIIGKPKIIVPEAADEILGAILGEVKKPCKTACLAKVAEKAPKAIDRIRKIHPPAHIVVISERYGDIYYKLLDDFPKLPVLKGYYKSKKKDKKKKK